MRLATLFLTFVPLVFSQYAAAQEDTNFRLSLGRIAVNSDPALAYSSDQKKQHFGWSISGEMPQSNYTASKATYYQIDDDRLDAKGIEMQIMWGYGLQQPGFRIYAGPAYFFEHRTDKLANTDRFDTYRDIALAAGAGYQYDRIVFNINYQYRDSRSYERELKKRGSSDSVDASTLNITLGYQF